MESSFLTGMLIGSGLGLSLIMFIISFKYYLSYRNLKPISSIYNHELEFMIVTYGNKDKSRMISRIYYNDPFRWRYYNQIKCSYKMSEKLSKMYGFHIKLAAKGKYINNSRITEVNYNELFNI